MKIVRPKPAELRRMRAADPEGTAWMDEVSKISTIGELVLLLARHAKKIENVSFIAPRTKAEEQRRGIAQGRVRRP